MDYGEMELLAELIGRAVAEELKYITLGFDAQSLGYAAAEAINENRARDGRVALDL